MDQQSGPPHGQIFQPAVHIKPPDGPTKFQYFHTQTGLPDLTLGPENTINLVQTKCSDAGKVVEENEPPSWGGNHESQGPADKDAHQEDGNAENLKEKWIRLGIRQ